MESYTTTKDSVSVENEMKIPCEDRISPVSVSKSQRLPYFEPMDLSVGSSYQVLVLAVANGPAKFSIQLITDSAANESMCAFLISYRFCKKLRLFEPGTTCFVKNSASAYRAIFSKSAGNNSHVYLVDAGKEKIVKTADLYELPVETHSHRMMSLRCSLAGFKSTNDHINTSFKELVKDRILECKVVQNYPAEVELYLEGRNIADLLSDRAKSGSPDLALAKEKLPHLKANLPHPIVESSSNGKLVRSASRQRRVATDSMGLFRAAMQQIQVQRKKETTMNLNSVIHSDSESASKECYKVDLCNNNLDAQPICHVKQRFSGDIQQCGAAAKDCDKASNDCQSYTKAETAVLPIRHMQQAFSYEIRSLEIGKVVGVTVTFVESPSVFFVVPDQEDGLLQFEHFMNSSTDDLERLIVPNVGVPCLYMSNGKWLRRGIITSLFDDWARVRAVDYGTEEVLSTELLKKMPLSFAKVIPPRAIECSLHTFDDVCYTPDIIRRFQELAPLGVRHKMRVMKKTAFGYEVELEHAVYRGNVSSLLALYKLSKLANLR